MTQLPSTSSILAPWSGSVGVEPMRIDLLMRDGKHAVSMVDFEALTKTPGRFKKAAGPPRVEREIVLVTGSHHKQIYWYATGEANKLGMVPWLWLIKDKQWVPRDAAFLRPTPLQPRVETGRWNEICIRCHVTGGRPRYNDQTGSEPASDVVEHGIACESCHGAAGPHGERFQNPLKRYWARLTGAKPGDVVHPAEEAAGTGSQVCGQCHAAWVFSDEDLWHKFLLDGPTYKPGEDLHKTRNVLRPTRARSQAPHQCGAREPSALRELFWRDGMIKVGGREYNAMLESACFESADDKHRIACSSCHAMHKRADDKRDRATFADDMLKPGMRGDKACTQCHKDAKWAAAEHTHHPPDSAGSRCMNCHMPHATYTLLKATRNHMIASPSARVTRRTGRPNACHLCHLDKSIRWTAEKLRDWYDQPMPDMDPNVSDMPVGVRFGLAGDALQRALTVWAMGWEPSKKASGDAWMPLVLIQRLIDPYPAVRYIATSSLRGHDGFAKLAIDWIGPATPRMVATANLFRTWLQEHNRRHVPEHGDVIGGPVPVTRTDFDRMLTARNDAEIDLPE